MVNYSHFIKEAMVLMKKPSVIESPSGKSPEKIPRWYLTGAEGCGGGKLVSSLPWMFGGYVDIYVGGRSTSVEQRGAHEGGGRAQGGRRAPLPRGFPVGCLT